MSTDIRPELSEKNKYWISRHRFYELKHFCLQYPEWSKAVTEIGLVHGCRYDDIYTKSIGDPTGNLATKRIKYLDKMQLVDDLAHEASPELYLWLLKGVTEGVTYPALSTRYGLPCCRDMYYDMYRKFFWLLDKKRE